MEKKPEWLKVRYNQEAVNEVAALMRYHKAVRHLRGGDATRRRYQARRGAGT